MKWNILELIYGTMTFQVLGDQSKHETHSGPLETVTSRCIMTTYNATSAFYRHTFYKVHATGKSHKYSMQLIQLYAAKHVYMCATRQSTMTYTRKW
jgi:hypothetical protein